MTATSPQASSYLMRALRFWDLLEDSDATKLSWTKIGVALSTVLTTVTGAACAVQQVVNTVNHTDWSLFAATIGLHTVTKGAHEIKRWTEAP